MAGLVARRVAGRLVGAAAARLGLGSQQQCCRGIVGGAEGYTKPRRTGIAHSCFTNGNVIVTISDFAGNAKTNASAGMVGFTGSRRDSKYAANAVAEHAARAAFLLGIKSVEVRIKGGFGVGKRKYLLRGFKQGGINVSKIRDITPIPHNGCRPPKKRRV